MQCFIQRDSLGIESQYEVIAVIEYRGRLTPSGNSDGHYICDVKDKLTGKWFRTNDNNQPMEIDLQDVSSCGYVILYKKVTIE